MNRYAKFAFGSALVTLLLIGALSYRGMLIADASERWVQHTHSVLENTQDMVIASESATSSMRGVAILGDASSQESYRTSMLAASAHLETLRTLTSDNAVQQRLLTNLEMITKARARFSDQVIQLRQTSGPEAAVGLIRTGEGELLRREFNTIVDRMREEELRLLDARSEEARQGRRSTIIAMILSTVLGLLITGAAAWGVERESSSRYRAEQAQLRSEQRIHGILRAAPDAMVVTRGDGTILELNDQTERQFGYARTELIGCPIGMILPDRQKPLAENSAESELQTGDGMLRAFLPGNMFGLRKDGSAFPVEITLSMLEDAEGVVQTTAIRDVTERIKIAQSLARTAAELRRSNIELEQFAYVASHDLQEPLRMVASFTELLATRYKGQFDQDADEFMELAVDGCKRMKVLIRDLLAYSRAGVERRPLQAISSEAALRTVLANLRASIKESGAIVTHDPLPVITTDETQFQQVLQNLLGNAIKYRSETELRIHISATMQGRAAWQFAVRDNGIGIDPRYAEKVFVLFQRLHRDGPLGGSGIGLSVCQRILERLGGRIWFESQPGAGSTFYFTLPVAGERVIQESPGTLSSSTAIMVSTSGLSTSPGTPVPLDSQRATGRA